MRRNCLTVLACLGLFTGPLVAQVINEAVANHTGTDTHAFVEIAGMPSTNYANLRILEIEGDSDSTPGVVDFVWTAGTTDGNGLWASTVPSGPRDPENGTITLLLVDGWSGAVAQDLDTNNDGVLDVTPWTTLLDAVSFSDGGASDRSYGVALNPNFDGITFTPGGASRVPNAVDTDTVADWKRNDFDGEGFAGFTGTPVAPEAINTPGAVNQAVGGGPAGLEPVINEVVIDHSGADAEESIEIWGQISAGYTTSTLVIIDGQTNPGTILHTFAVGTTNGVGVWRTADLPTDSIDNSSLTVLLVEGFSGAVSQDLDTNNDGILDTTPWTTLYDSVAFSDGAGVDLFYSSTLLTPNFDGLATVVGGASRLPHGVDTDALSDWTRNDFGGEGLPSFPDGTLGTKEARNTAGATNRGFLPDFWAGVVPTSGAALRAAVHARIDDHQRIAYTSADADTWEVLELADENPSDALEIIAPYKNEAFVKFGGGVGPYNREHTWPQSWGFPDDAVNNYPRSDCHHLFLEEVNYNADRGRRPFGTCNAGCTERGTLANNGVGGVGGPYPGDSNWFTGSDDENGIFEVWNHRKGDIARAQLYLDVRYEGGMHGATGYNDPELILTDNLALIAASDTNNNELLAHMGRLATLLAWHAADPPDARELYRNDVVWRYQGNRNPFVDHPEWVACIWNNVCAETPMFADGFESGNTNLWSSTVP